jgi:hypothetical protein
MTFDYDPEFRIICRVSHGNQMPWQEMCALLLELDSFVKRIRPKDLIILRAVLDEDSISAAARKLAPDRPGFRVHIQQRLKASKETLAALLSKTSFGKLSRLKDGKKRKKT